MPAKEAAGGEIVSHQHPQGRSLQGAQIVGHAMRCACAHRGTVRSNITEERLLLGYHYH